MSAAVHFRRMAAYNAAANRLLRRRLDDFPIHEYFKTRKNLFFGSVHATLGHMLGAERIWFHRLTGQGAEDAEKVLPFYELEGAALQRAWESYIDEKAELWVQMEEQEQAWQDFVEEVYSEKDEDGLAAEPVREYTDTEGERVRIHASAGLAQVFNHATHHRGQITAAFDVAAWSHAAPQEGYVSLDMQNFW